MSTRSPRGHQPLPAPPLTDPDPIAALIGDNAIAAHQKLAALHQRRHDAMTRVGAATHALTAAQGDALNSQARVLADNPDADPAGPDKTVAAAQAELDAATRDAAAIERALELAEDAAYASVLNVDRHALAEAYVVEAEHATQAWDEARTVAAAHLADAREQLTAAIYWRTFPELTAPEDRPTFAAVDDAARAVPLIIGDLRTATRLATGTPKSNRYNNPEGN